MKEKITIVNPKDESLETGFKHYIDVLEAMNRSPQTIIYYKNCFQYFTEFIEEYELDKSCSNINQKIIIQYINYLHKSKPDLSERTVKSYLVGLRAFIYFLQKERYTDEFKIEIPKTEKAIKEPYSDAEVERLIEQPDLSKCTFSNLRDWAIVSFFLATGCRLSTATNVRIGDINFREQEIFIRKTKNRKQQILPLSPELERTLKIYLRYRQGEKDDYLFCNAYGQYLTKNSITSCIRNYNLSKGVLKTSIHRFRHTFAKNWIINGGDIFRLQKILGHSTLDMVKEYLALYGNDLKRDYEKFSVLDRVKSENANNSPTQRIKMKNLTKKR